MIDMNDPEVIESLKFLLVPKQRKIELAAMPYSSTKNFFVPCHEEGFECAEITNEDGDNITLMTRKGKVSSSLCLYYSKTCIFTPKPKFFVPPNIVSSYPNIIVCTQLLFN